MSPRGGRKQNQVGDDIVVHVNLDPAEIRAPVQAGNLC